MSVPVHSSRRLRVATIVAIAVAVIATAVPTVTARGIATGPAAEALAARAAVGPQSSVVGGIATARAAEAPAAAAVGPMLGGFTSQQWPAVIGLGVKRRYLTVAEIGMTLNCISGGQLDLPVGAGQVPVPANGAFHVARTIPAQPGNPVSLTGGSESFSGVLHRSSSTLSGTWRLRLNFKASDGSTDQCDSGVVHLSARL